MITCSCCGGPADIDDADPVFAVPDAIHKEFGRVPEVPGRARGWGLTPLAIASVSGPRDGYIRCLLEVQVVDRERPCRFGVWARVANEDVNDYIDRNIALFGGDENATAEVKRSAFSAKHYPATLGNGISHLMPGLGDGFVEGAPIVVYDDAPDRKPRVVPAQEHLAARCERGVTRRSVHETMNRMFGTRL